MVMLFNTEPTAESLTKPPTFLGLGLVVASVAVVGFALRDGDVVTALGMGLLFALGMSTTGTSLSGRSV